MKRRLIAGGRLAAWQTVLLALCLLLLATCALTACVEEPLPGDGTDPAVTTDSGTPSDSPTPDDSRPVDPEGTTSPSDTVAHDTVSPSDTNPTVSPDESASVEPDTPSEPATETEPGAVMTLPSETVPEPETDAVPMPRLDIVTDGGVGIESKDFYVHATLSLSQCHEAYAFEGVTANLRVRGNSTAAAPKKPYRLKFDEKRELLGLAGGKAFKNWCLMADYYDGSMLRTYGTFQFAKALMERKYFSSDATHVEVWLNGSFQGVYLLCEQTQMNRYRIDIPEKEDGDTSLEHGYLLIGQGGRFDEPGNVVVYPEITVRDRNGDTMYFGGMNFALSGGDYTDEQKQYVSDYVSGVFKVVAHAVYDHEYYELTRKGNLIRKRSFDWATTEEEKQIETISAVFNIESAVSMCILDEIVKNLDAMTFNMYVDLSPEGDGVLTLAAPWDFDFSMANTHYGSTHSYNGFYATNLSYSEGMRTNLWYVMLGSIDWFEEMVKAHWQENYVELQAVVSDMISVNYAYDAAFNRDYERWGLPVNRSLIHHHDQNDLGTFDEHLKAGTFVTDWLTMRLWWLNTQWGDGTDTLPPFEPAEELQLTFKTEADMAIVNGIKRCTVELTKDGLRLAPDAEARDPYFSFDYDLLGGDYDAMLYPYLEFTYRIPTSASKDTYYTELFLCSGSVWNATGGISTGVEVKADGKWHTVRVDLRATGHWGGEIHEIRLDFFSDCAPGDAMYLRDFKLLAS